MARAKIMLLLRRFAVYLSSIILGEAVGVIEFIVDLPSVSRIRPSLTAVCVTITTPAYLDPTTGVKLPNG